MELWKKFGEFDSWEEINAAAEGLKNEGDTESLYALAEENGIDKEDAEEYFNDPDMKELCTPIMAALGKLDVEAKALGLPKDILINDWVAYVRLYISEDPAVAREIRKKEKSLVGCLAEILKASFNNQWTVPGEITKAAKISASRVTFGVVSTAECNRISKGYYGGH